ncbi:twin-arginine translocase subunit TatC [Fulvivirga sp. 2943]|uniref:Sec-independent protein translocase protein TatC n=2 Tax=Fulvivirga sediminis TaxID=2803949 RepID=A0A937F4T8_9BACT|nr:twin-arginine translocase subunit TatC [Fulvivirga sediminis]MBL3654892.1 twin-arginine translocase subunit TatC [Fulvivirga sediminis]
MSFLDHLEELRWHLVRSMAAILLFSIAAFVMKDFVFGTVIFGPAKPDFWTFRMLCKLGDWLHTPAICIDSVPFKIQSRQMTGQFTMHITTSVITGLIITFPYVFWEIWRFIKPGLYSTERQSTRGAVFFVTLLFLLGVLFGYYILSPLSVNFLANYTVSDIVYNEFDITSYVGTLTTLVLGSGILFQLPIVVYVLSRIGIITPEIMRTYRKHAIVVILIMGAILTPPDPLSQILISVPLFGLYEISIMISRQVTRKQRKEELMRQRDNEY